MTRLVTFDLDGTLIDSANTVLEIINDLRLGMGKEKISKKNILPWISLGGSELIKNALEIDEDLSVQGNLDLFRAAYLQKKCLKSDIFPYVVDLLDELKKSEFKIAICTNKPRKLVDKIISELCWEGYFDYVLAGGDLETQKPHPRNLLICNETLGVAAERTILIGDSTVDQNISDLSGIKFCWYRKGYDDGVDINRVDLCLDSYFNAANNIKRMLR
jgi:phosphoglycolate phosphatase